MSSTPVSPEGLKQFDEEPPYMAIARAWTEPGINPSWHYHVQQTVRSIMPVLGRALDRQAEEYLAWRKAQREVNEHFANLAVNKIVVPEELKPQAGEN